MQQYSQKPQQQQPQTLQTKYRECRFGKACKDFKQNKCNFQHSEIEEEKKGDVVKNRNYGQQESMQDTRIQAMNPSLQEEFKKIEAGMKSKKRPCKYSDEKCFDFQRGECRYLHESGVNELKQNKQHREERHQDMSKKINQQPRDPQSHAAVNQPIPQPLRQPQPLMGQRPQPQNAPALAQPRIKREDRKKQEDQKKTYFSYNQVKEILDLKDIDQIKSKLAGLKGSFTDRLNGTILQKGVASLIIQLIDILLKDKQSEISRLLVTEFVDSDFFKNWKEYINKTQAQLGIIIDEKLQDLLLAISVMSRLLDLYPSNHEKFRGVISELYMDVELFSDMLSPENQTQLNKEAKQLLKKHKEMLVKKEEVKQKKPAAAREPKKRIDPALMEEYKQLPELDFKDIDIIPGDDELKLNNAKIRMMPEQGDLINSHNYLDIVFRLLHEDAISDLRKGVRYMCQVNQYEMNKRDLRRKLKEQQVKLYDQITLQSLECIEGARCVIFRLYQDKKRFIDWRISKKLLPGSLVILSTDGFQTLYIALLMNSDSRQRNETHQRYGYIQLNVEILKSSNEIESYQTFFMENKDSNFQMIESTAYFEAYRHVLKQLQIMDTWPQLPMQRQLVHGRSEFKVQPLYLTELFRDKRPEVEEEIKKMGLDESQNEALRNTLSTEIALIQGPPGTGKTYVGVQLVKLLLKYKRYWHQKGPIMLVTYTNHALNQFLHFIKDYTQKIVKIGGQKDEGLEQFSWREKFRNMNLGSDFNKSHYRLKDLTKEIEQQKKELLKYEFKCINTVLAEEDDGMSATINDLIHIMKEHFPHYLNLHLVQYDEATKNLVNNSLKQLRELTKWNILVFFWLGILDLPKFIEYIIEDEKKKLQIQAIGRQIQKIEDVIYQVNIKLAELDNRYQEENINLTNVQRLLNGEPLEEDKSGRNRAKYQHKKPKSNIQELKKLNLEQLHQREQNHLDELTRIDIEYQKYLKDIENSQAQIMGLENQIAFIRGVDPNMAALGLQLDDNIEKDERELDYDDFRFLNNESIDALQNVLDSIWKPDLSNYEIFSECEYLMDCFTTASQFRYQDDQVSEASLDVFLSSIDIFSPEHTLEQRWAINNFIIESLVKVQVSRLDFTIEKYKSMYKVKKEYEAKAYGPLLKEEEIIAMTTTGRAKYSDYIAKINSPIVIVEEAAEVFEAHIIASLTERTQHLILIGDHEQLRPSPAVHDHDVTYNLSMSMFERLIKNNVDHSTLQTQRRMRPEISRIMNFIYPNLQNHEIVTKYPEVQGVNKSVFFFNHNFQEDSNDLMMSKLNIKEAEIIVRFTWYLLQQKQYKPQQITILTLYAGQLLKIKSLIKQDQNYNVGMKGLRVVNVDNYQGEENEVIILSLVRSNQQNQIGFLKISNRVCVALSRAKHGLYIFGNSQCLIGANKLDLWKNVIEYLSQKDFYGNELVLKCQQHSALARIKTASDFKNVPEGGCNQICSLRLDCGHSCESLCHPFERTDLDPTGHSSLKCLKPCIRERSCGHDCSYKCFECKSGDLPCKTKVEKLMSPCGHIMEVECHRSGSLVKCEEECERLLECGHKCTRWCGEDCKKFACREQVSRRLRCGHTVEMDCGKNPDNQECYKKCGELLECGHQCTRECKDCTKEGDHGRCEKKCDRIGICGHKCQEPCTKNCPPCSRECATKCIHSKCSLKCAEECILCKEPCENKCKHSQCSKKCSEPCDREPCNFACLKIRQCGHKCMGLCGEECPDICRDCKPDDQTFEIYFGEEKEILAKFVKIDCGHCFEVDALDKWMEMIQGDGAVRYKECPRCKQPIMNCRRYMQQINSTLNDINQIKAKILINEQEYQAQIEKLSTDHETFNGKLSTFDLVSEGSFKTLSKLYIHFNQNFKRIRKFRETHLLEESIQSLNYLYDLLTLAKVELLHMSSLYMSRDKYDIVQCFDKAKNFKSLTKADKDKAKALSKKLSDEYHMEDEFRHIIDAIGLSRGHWNKCPNGHFYVIADCGGAMEESKCPDCQAVIGGANHRLAAGNQHASELGGRPAWDPQGFDAQVLGGQINLRNQFQ